MDEDVSKQARKTTEEFFAWLEEAKDRRETPLRLVWVNPSPPAKPSPQ